MCDWERRLAGYKSQWTNAPLNENCEVCVPVSQMNEQFLMTKEELVRLMWKELALRLTSKI